MTEVEGTPLSVEETQETMRQDIVALLSQHIECPLARAIEAALADFERAIEAHKPKPD